MTASALKKNIEPIYKATDNPASRALSKRQMAFVELYNGNLEQTAIKAGYSVKAAKIAGIRNMKNDTVRYLIQQRQTKELKPQVFSRIERQIYWSDIMRDTEQDMKNRLKASELLARSEGDFLDRVEHTGDIELCIRWAD
jgi:phage terminase small subunit